MARRKNVKRIDPRYFLNETVNRNDDGSRLEEDLDEGLYGDIDLAMPADERSAEELAADDLDASGEERLAFEKDPRAHSRAARTIDRSNYATNPPGKQDIYQFLKQDHPEVWAMWNQEQEIEEGFKDFVQGTKDTFRDITKGRKLGKTRQIRKDKEAALDYEAGRADREKEAERDRREKRGDKMSMVQRLAQAQRLADRDGGSSSGSDDAIYNAFGGSKARMAQDRYDKRQRDKASRRRQKVKDELEADAFSKKQRELAADRPKSNTAYVGSGGVGSSKRYNEE